MKTPNRLIVGAAVLVGLGLSACSQMSEPEHGMDESHHASSAGASQHGHDAATMQRHAAEAKQMEERMRTHLQQMRGLSTQQQHARMGEHASAVGQMLSMMDRHMREMGMGTGHTHMGQMMGMSRAQHDQMMKEMQALRAELERLQTLPAAEVGRQMPAHLDRLERMLPMLQQCAGHTHHS
jgi:outer membrane murein-binding lipoprotein Lpp